MISSGIIHDYTILGIPIILLGEIPINQPVQWNDRGILNTDQMGIGFQLVFGRFQPVRKPSWRVPQAHRNPFAFWF